MGIPHYHHCTGDCPDGLTAAAVAASIRPEPVVPRGAERYEPRDPAEWSPGAGLAAAREYFGQRFIEITEEDLRAADAIIAAAVPTHEERTEEKHA